MNHLVVDHIGKEIVTLHQGGGVRHRIKGRDSRDS